MNGDEYNSFYAFKMCWSTRIKKHLMEILTQRISNLTSTHSELDVRGFFSHFNPPCNPFGTDSVYLSVADHVVNAGCLH